MSRASYANAWGVDMATLALRRERVATNEGVTPAILLALLLICVTGSIATAGWTGNLGLALTPALSALVLGSLIAPTRARGWLAHLFMLTLGVPAATLFFLPAFPNLLTLEQRLNVIALIWRTWFSLRLAGENIVSIFLSKQGLLITDVAPPLEQRADTIDPIFLMILLYAMWMLAYLSAWFLYRRHQVWGAILLPGAAMVINLFYAQPQSGLYLGLFLLGVLLLLVRVNLNALEGMWRRAAVGYSTDITFDFISYGALFALLLILLAWILPPTAPGPEWLKVFDTLQAQWQEFEDNFQHNFFLRPAGRPQPSPFGGATLVIGGPPNLGQRPVMNVQATAGRYWRGTVYDKYMGFGWVSTHNDSLNLNANDARLGNAGDALRQEITQTVQVLLPESTILFAAAQPLRFDVPTEIRYAQPPASLSPALDLALARPRRALRAGDKYTAISAISIADEVALRRAARDYPEWIAANYLALPDDLPRRVRDLARTITAAAENPHDQAAALEAYLRTKITYNDSVSAPPAGRDGVDYMLFERPEGYCNYYASALAVLARAVGIPARVASGYALGDYRDGVYSVFEFNAHAWPELYFPGYGWIEFEPTASQPLIERPKRFAPTSDDSATTSATDRRSGREANADLLDDELNQNPGNRNVNWYTNVDESLRAALAAAAILAFAMLAALAARQWQFRARFARLAPSAQAYAEMIARAGWLSVRTQEHATPFETAQMIGEAIPQGATAVDRIASLYVRERYGARPLSPGESAALRVMRQDFRAAWRQRIVQHAMELVVARINRVIERINELGERAER